MNRVLMQTFIVLVLAANPFLACEKKQPPTSSKSHVHNPGDGHTHDDDHGAMIDLGEQTVSGFTVRVSLDHEVHAGGDAPIDASISGGAPTERVTVVRFWIGLQDAVGSVKAKAEIEKDHWHTHAEVPDPLPAGSRLWVEFETDGGGKHSVGFDLKR